jgi:hypothetical protein
VLANKLAKFLECNGLSPAGIAYVTGINASIIIQIQIVKRLEWPAAKKSLDNTAWTWVEI